MSGSAGWVIKLGGSVLETLDADFFAALRALQARCPLVVVHGGGKAIDARLKAAGIEAVKKDGLRVTDAATLAVVEAVLSGEVNGAVVRALLRAGVKAWGVSGCDMGWLVAEPKDGGALGFVGRVTHVDPTPLDALVALGAVPVVSPIGFGEGAQAYNINADEAAAAVAAALGYGVVFVSDVPGILVSGATIGAASAAAQAPAATDPSAGGGLSAESDPPAGSNPPVRPLSDGRFVLTAAAAEDVEALIRDGTLTGGMIPKARAAAQAVFAGAPEAWITGGDAAALSALEPPGARRGEPGPGTFGTRIFSRTKEKEGALYDVHAAFR
ncbi:MAG: acetylglutamate kinase [Hydrogenibacillus sp.]|nr:acetylglutamate kinase [Hydrogenibacillus sp.]